MSDSYNYSCSMKNYPGLKVDAGRLVSSKYKKFKQFLVIWLRTGNMSLWKDSDVALFFILKE